MRVVRPASSPSWISALLLGSLLLLGATLPAQEPPEPPPARPRTQPMSQPQSKPTGQVKLTPEEAPPELTPQERLAGLLATLARLKSEKQRLEKIEQSGGLGKRVMTQLKRRNVRGDAAEAMGPAMPKAKTARLMGDAEKATLDDDVIFTVDSIPVTTKEFDSLFAYLRSYPRPLTVAAIKAETISTLVQARAAEAATRDQTAKALATIKKIHKAIGAGGNFRDLAKQHSNDQATAEKGGDLGYITRDYADKICAKALFNMNLGEVSGIVRGADGFYILRVRGAKKGDSPDKDRVRASHILVRYSSEDTLKNVKSRVASADVDLAFRDKELRKFAPEPFAKPK